MKQEKKRKQVTPDNPSSRATARVKDPLPAPTCCNYCDSTSIELVNNSAIYGKSYGEWPYAFMCNNCRSYVGLHPFTRIPLGTLADKETRDARSAAKLLFMKYYQSNGLSRSEAYTNLAHSLGINVRECHFGWFDVDMCTRVEQTLIELTGK